MIETIRYKDGSSNARLDAILSRSTDFSPDLEVDVREIVQAVRRDGDRAIIHETRRLDGVELTQDRIRVPLSELECAHERSDPHLRRVIASAAENIRRFHEKQIRHSWYVDDGDEVILGKRILPIERVGILIPGSSAPLFSTLLMAAIPAQIAGVPSLCMATPPQPDGSVHPAILATAHALEIDEVYRVFGAQAVAALAYGTESVPRVDKLVGPGHPSVQIAKKIVFGDVDIDMVAGPSEIVVLADATADPRLVAADLLSQAEHGSGYEAAICIATSESKAVEVAAEIARQLADLSSRETIRRALDNFGAVVIVKSLDDGFELINRIAPEHLELLVEKPWDHLDRVKNAGAIFLGPTSAESVGDYYAGTNHILPTTGAARFASSVGVETYLKSISVMAYSEKRLKKTAGHIIAMAEAEGFDAHANAIRVRQV